MPWIKYDQGKFGTCVIHGCSRAIVHAFTQQYPEFDFTSDHTTNKIKDYFQTSADCHDKSKMNLIREKGTTCTVVLDWLNSLLAKTEGIAEVHLHKGGTVKLTFRVGFFEDFAKPLDTAKKYAANDQLQFCAANGERTKAPGEVGRHCMHAQALNGDQITCGNSWGDELEYAIGKGGLYPKLTSICHIAIFDVRQWASNPIGWEDVKCSVVKVRKGFSGFCKTKTKDGSWEGQLLDGKQHGYGISTRAGQQTRGIWEGGICVRNMPSPESLYDLAL